VVGIRESARARFTKKIKNLDRGIRLSRACTLPGVSLPLAKADCSLEAGFINTYLRRSDRRPVTDNRASHPPAWCDQRVRLLRLGESTRPAPKAHPAAQNGKKLAHRKSQNIEHSSCEHLTPLDSAP
jgi:hypothetical protein